MHEVTGGLPKNARSESFFYETSPPSSWLGFQYLSDS